MVLKEKLISNKPPPAAGNRFSVETIKPVQPNIKDSYSFKIEGAKIDYNK